MKKIIFVFIAAAVLSSVSTGQKSAVFDSLIYSGIDQIYSLRFEEARTTFKSLNKNYPNHPSGKFFDAMITWWKILLDMNNTEFDDEFYDKLEEVIDMCDDILDEDPENLDAIFFKGGALGFRGRLKAIRRDWLDAALDGKDALPLVHRANDIDPDMIDLKLGFGIYNYYAVVIPEEYPFIKPLLFFLPEGNKEDGLKQIQAVADSGKYAKYEAQYFLLTSYYNFEDDYRKSLVYSERLFNKFPQNPRFHRLLGRNLIKLNRYEQADSLWRIVVERCENCWRGYINKVKREALYYIADQHKRKNEIDSAIIKYAEVEKLSEEIDYVDANESGFLINAVLYQGMLYDKKGLRNKAIKKYEKVLDLDDYRESHEKAERYLKKPYSF